MNKPYPFPSSYLISFFAELDAHNSKPTIAQLLDDHVKLTLHSLDRIYPNGYVPKLQAN